MDHTISLRQSPDGKDTSQGRSQRLILSYFLNKDRELRFKVWRGHGGRLWKITAKCSLFTCLSLHWTRCLHLVAYSQQSDRTSNACSHRAASQGFTSDSSLLRPHYTNTSAPSCVTSCQVSESQRPGEVVFWLSFNSLSSGKQDKVYHSWWTEIP
jgi:hypothetical protein